MMFISALIPLALLAAVIFGLFLLVQKETKNMQTTNNNSNPGLPMEEKHSPAFHLFLYLVSFLSLGFMVGGIIGTYFQLINKMYKEPTDAFRYVYDFDQNTLKFTIAALLVATPIYFGVLYFINRKLQKQDIGAASLIRKFTTYLALFIFSAMALGSLVGLIYNYLDGELTAKAFFKIIIFFVVSAYFFVFYFWEIRRADYAKNFLALFIVSLALAVSALVTGLVIIDSPQVVREKKQDQQLVDRMRNLTYNIESFYRANQRLPKLKDNEIVSTQEIQYVEAGEKEYKLCANFKQEAAKQHPEDEWNHPAGKHCFDFDAAAVKTGPLNEPIGADAVQPAPAMIK